MSQDTQRQGYRWRVAARVLAAILGGYTLTSLTISALALMLVRFGISSPAVAVLATTLGGFILYATIAIWVFSASHVGKIWGCLGAWSVVMMIVVMALKPA